MLRELIRARSSMRERDVNESRYLLWELVTNEPTVLQCFGIVESTCMAQGLFCKVDAEACSEEFQAFVDRHYIPFCRAAIRAFFTYGFVPWYVRKLQGGDEVPEVLPNGTFEWNTEVPSPQSVSGKQVRDPALVTYRVRITAPLRIKDEDVRIYIFTPPSLDTSVYSVLYATVPSPLAHILTDYKNLRSAQIRRAHADSWNTTAKLICSFKPSVRVQEDPTSSLMDFADASYFEPLMRLGLPAMAPLQATNLWTRDAQIRKQFEGASVTHQPDVFTLPRDHDVAQQPMLNPCEDIEFLLAKFQRDVCAVTRVPEEMIRSQSRGHETVRKTMASGRIFNANMNELCRHLSILLLQAYEDIYGDTNAEFILLPMPRLEIETVDDMKVLFDIGALTPDTSLQLSRILMGDDIENKRKRDVLQQGAAGQQQQKANSQDVMDKEGLRSLKGQMQGPTRPVPKRKADGEEKDTDPKKKKKG